MAYPAFRNTTNFPGGQTNVSPDATFGSYTGDDLSDCHELFDDFNGVSVGTTATSWLATKVGTTPTVVASSTEGGAALITTSTGASDSCFLQWLGMNASAVAANFNLSLGNRAWFKTRLQTDNATLAGLIFGMYSTNTTPMTSVADGFYFKKTAGAATVDFTTVIGSTAKTSSAVATMVDATWITLGFYWDGAGTVSLFANDIKVGGQVNVSPTTAQLALGFGIQNSTGVARTMTVDYIYAAAGRPYP
jgi:hypothetical protein